MQIEVIKKLALQAGAAKFYADNQHVKEDNYLVSQGFLEKFASKVLEHHHQSK